MKTIRKILGKIFPLLTQSFKKLNIFLIKKRFKFLKSQWFIIYVNINLFEIKKKTKFFLIFGHTFRHLVSHICVLMEIRYM